MQCCMVKNTLLQINSIVMWNTFFNMLTYIGILLHIPEIRFIWCCFLFLFTIQQPGKRTRPTRAACAWTHSRAQEEARRSAQEEQRDRRRRRLKRSREIRGGENARSSWWFIECRTTPTWRYDFSKTSKRCNVVNVVFWRRNNAVLTSCVDWGIKRFLKIFS